MAHTLTHAAAAVIVLAGLGVSSRVVADGSAPQCGPGQDMIKAAHDRYGENPAFSGTLESGTPFMITVSPKGTFTVFVLTDGRLCVGNSGDHWQAVEAPAAKSSPGSLPAAPALLEHGLRLIRG